jgi:DNA replication protein DnaC
VTPIYEDAKGDVWGETSVLTFDYERYYPGAVNKSIRKEWFVEGEEILGVCECVFRAAYEEKCREINIPSGLAKKDFRSFEVHDGNRDAYQASVEFSLSYSPDTVKGIGLYGAIGVGKTHLASAIICQILMDQIKRGEQCSAGFFSVPRLLRDLRWWRTDEAVTEERETYGQVSDKQIVILDDLGIDRLNDKQLEQLFLIIDDRLINEKPLIVTTNLDPYTLDDLIGERVADRLREACSWHEIKGQSWRGRGT